MAKGGRAGFSLAVLIFAAAITAVAEGESHARPAGERVATDPAADADLQAHVAGQWTWRSGGDEIADAASYGVYGTKGVPGLGNVPGARFRPVAFEGPNGVRYLFGGTGHSESGFGFLNDLWKWDGARWAWLSGSKGPDQLANYGTKGVPAGANVPGARAGSVSWTDLQGNLWLFGGQGWGESGTGYLNDLWKWDGTNWTWVSGSNLPNQSGTYGSLGVADSANVPGARRYSVSWLDSAGNLWLFGGEGYSAGPQGWLNDLWKWDGSNWTWVSGSSSAATVYGTYGTKGTPEPANVPGGREGAASWNDPAGNLWLFGGFGVASAGNPGFLNDLWRWDGTNWTWMSGESFKDASPVYGSRGVPAPGNVPGGREFAVSWRDSAGHLWFFGGYNAGSSPIGNLNDLWRWDGTNWTWMSGSSFADSFGTYGTRGVPAPGNSPGARQGGVSWLDANGNLVHFGGYGNASGTTGWLNDLWKWDGTSWTWASGSNAPNEAGRYGTKGVPLGPTHPGARLGAASWTDTGGNLWLFGGEGKSSTGTALLNDLWKWDGSSWTWMGGSSGPSAAGTYGAKFVAAPGNTPGGRREAAVWADAAGNVWLFGGNGLGATGQGYLNDLWRWDGSYWTWISGSSTPGQFGTYGSKGVAAPSNVPGARAISSSWLAPGGVLWLFGGSGNGASSAGFLNDLWKWDGTNWTWVSGTGGVNQTGSYGSKGVPAAGNAPGARGGAFGWRDAGGRLWLGGGFGYSATGQGSLNDLWKWDGTEWTWVGGSSVHNQPGTYGTKGVAAASNVPGARVYALSWSDSAGNAWVFGGNGIGASTANSGPLNDLWKWDGTNWTWLSGSSSVNPAGVYGARGVPAPGNVPGGRQRAVSWRDSGGNLWLGTGFGYSASGLGNLDDLWKWDGGSWTWIGGTDVPVRKPTYGTKGTPAPSNQPGVRQAASSWRDPAGNLWLFGGEGVGSNGSGWLNDLWRWDGAVWTWVSGASAANQLGSYGSKGVADPGNVPGARYGAATWTDATGHLWLFGGFGNAAFGSGWLNDLWRWDGNNWTWVSGSNTTNQYGSYGSRNVAGSGNAPGGRYGAVTWTDASGNLWLFGGYGYAASAANLLNDLWKWDGTAWIWLSGSDTPDQAGTYGAKGVSSTLNVPGARYLSTSFTDVVGNAWLFGGSGVSATTAGSLNDLWRWDGQKWTWMSGSNAPGDPGLYGTQGVPTGGNTPGARYSAVSWSRPNGELWLFGGSGVSPAGQGDLRDLWRWDGSMWTWMSGSSGLNETGSYGAKDLSSAGTFPGSRSSAVSWTDRGGNLWLFGGKGYGSTGSSGLLDDLWVRAFSSCFEPSAVVTTAPNVCAVPGGTLASVPNAGAGATYVWTVSGGSIVSGAGTRTISFNPAGGASAVSLHVAVTAAGGCRAIGDATIPVSLVAHPGNDGPACQGGTVQLSVNVVAGAGYSWTGPAGFTSSQMQPTIANVTPAKAGDYFVTITSGGCASAPAATSVIVNPRPAAPYVSAPSVVCAGSPGNLASVPDAGVGASYAWGITNGFITGGDGTPEITFTAGSTGSVGLSVIVTPSSGCASPEAAIAISIRALCLDPIPTPIVIGATKVFTGSGFTAGSVIKLFVSTASGPVDTNTSGWTPTSWTPTSLTWNIPTNVPLGQGFATLQVVNTDQGYVSSNLQYQHLHGDAADGLPTILSIDGVGLSAPDPSIPGAHVETVVPAGSTVTITGTGFNGPLVNLFTAAGNLGPLLPVAGGSSTSFQVVIPANAPAGPGSFQVVNSGSGYTLSNAVDAVLRARVTVTSVSVNGSTVTVTGDGFCGLTVINLFNVQGGGVVNLGGLTAGGAPVIPLSNVTTTSFTFTLPAGAQSGPAYVMALNPPFTPFTSSGTDPGGAFNVP